MSLSWFRHAFVLSAMLLAPSLAAAQPTQASPDEPEDVRTDAPFDEPAGEPAFAHGNGMLLEVRIVTGQPQELIEDAPEPRGALFAGYQGRRFAFGVGLELARRTLSTDSTSTLDDTAFTTYMVVPGARVTLGQSADRRAELVGRVDLGWGETRFVRDEGFGPQETWFGRFRFEVGPEIRYWLADAFAVGAAGVVRYESTSYVSDFDANEDQRHRTEMVTSLNVAGVF